MGGALLLPLLATGCSSESAGELADPVGVPGEGAALAFDHDGTLTLAPGEKVEVSAVGNPRAPYAMTFLLIGDSLDASLDRTEVVANSDGRGTVTLRAPNRATYFAVKVTIKDGPSATLNVAVSEHGFGTLSIRPTYNGKRETREWVTSVVAGTTCANLAPTLPTDPEGPEPVVGEPEELIVIEDVPVGPNLAIFVRAGHYMWGCTDEPDLVANATIDVDVPIIDAPLDLGSANLDVTFDVVPNEAEWATMTADQREALISAFIGGGDVEQMLLTALGAAYAGNAQDFADASAGWDIADHLATHGVDFPGALTAFVNDGLLAEPKEMTATVAGVENAPNHAVFTLRTFGSAPPEVMNVPSEYVTSFTADPDDTVRLGGTLFWMPSRYLGYVAEQAGHDAHPGHGEFAEVLGEIMQCESLSLDGLVGCSGQCVVDLCLTALGNRWEAALASSAATLSWGELPFESSGKSRFDDGAVVTGFTGTWLGLLVASGDTAKVSGGAVAEDAGQQPE